MIELTVIDRSGKETRITCTSGATLKNALLEAGINEIDALTSCGGNCACATCHVFLELTDGAAPQPPNAAEDSLLDIHEARAANSRLSCQVTVTPELAGARVQIAPEL